MHEMGIAVEVARIAREEALARGALRVTALRVRVGLWSGVDPESLRFALETLTSSQVAGPGDLLASCRIGLDLVPPRFRCPACHLSYEGSGYLDPCPACGSLGGELTSGEELHLSEIEVEDA